MKSDIQYLLSLPPKMAAAFEEFSRKRLPDWFAGSDPEGARLGSGGGTAHLLVEAHQATGKGQSWSPWLQDRPKLIIHGGGQSRRLPAYAPTGKILLPIPAFRWARGQRLDQTLLDVQLPDYERVLQHGRGAFAAMICSGDVLLRFASTLPEFPEVDVVGLGMRVPAELAKDFGVFFTSRRQPDELAFFLQKPSPEEIREQAVDHDYLIDTGMWLLSERAVRVLMQKCGRDDGSEQFSGGTAERYELYSEFGLGLGSSASQPDPDLASLTSAVVELPEAEFYHFGTCRQMIESVSLLQNRDLDQSRLGLVGAKRHPDLIVQNSKFDYSLILERNHTLWVENSHIPKSWTLCNDHVLTGVPENDWDPTLEPGVCLDFVPVGEDEICVRAYGFEDPFRGSIEAETTTWFGRPVRQWFGARGVEPSEAGLAEGTDIQQASLFPVMKSAELDARFIEWLFQSEAQTNETFSQLWLQSRRLSADEIGREANLSRLREQRDAHRRSCIVAKRSNARWSGFHRLDLNHTARDLSRSGDAEELAAIDWQEDDDPMLAVHDEMFRAAVERHRDKDGWDQHEGRAFALMRERIVREAQLQPANPTCSVKADQIVWGRSPVRLDLAGGWTDTPPYCLEHGGQVVNMAVDLNGQPPIQVFARLSPEPELVVRSIDLGVEQQLRTYKEIDTFDQPGSEFALAKAAFALAGFLPRFRAHGRFGSLEDQLKDFGGGIELTLLSAVPKGSGLGTSSILAATLLATLGDLCGLKRDPVTLFKRTLAMEQMLTTGGGWQDQAGAIFGGIKLIETSAGLDQTPSVRWLPDRAFGEGQLNRTVLLYYTGLTRLAKNILQEIVRGMFLNSPAGLRTLEQIGANARRCFHAIEGCDAEAVAAAIDASWQLNQALDSGTNPPAVQAILDQIQPWTAAVKLLGAGGGGFLLIVAKDPDAGAAIRRSLEKNPPNELARFVEMRLSQQGLEVTRS